VAPPGGHRFIDRAYAAQIARLTVSAATDLAPALQVVRLTSGPIESHVEQVRARLGS
jgi:hypothetical protein